MASCIQGQEETILTKVWGSTDAIKYLVRVVTRSTCLIEPLIPPRVDFKREVLIPTKSVHYASETSIGPFRYLFRMNLRPEKPCAVIKATEWLKLNVSLFGNFFYCTPVQPNPPEYILFSYIMNPPAQVSWEHRDVLCESTQVTSWYYYRDAS
jgi:hypothetical protein